MKPISSIFSCIKFSSPLIMRVVGLHWALFNTSFSPYLNWGNLQLYTLFQVLPMKFQVEWTNHMPLSAGFYLTDAAQVCLPCCPTTLLISVHFSVRRGTSAELYLHLYFFWGLFPCAVLSIYHC